MKLRRPMSSYMAPSWSGAKWVGEIDYESFTNPGDDGATQTIYLEEADGYTNASLLVRQWGGVMGFIDVPVFNSFMMRSDIEPAVKNLPVPARPKALTAYPQFTVAICTHNRAAMLDEALASVMKLDYPNFNVLVVENAPLNTETADLLASKYPTVTYAVAPIKGLSYARNIALKAASSDYIAFTDDDVVVDKFWLHALAATFAEDGNIACVTGLVPSGEVISPAQAYFDQRVTWSHILDKSYYSLAQPPKDVPAFPFAVGRYGTGANFAIRRNLIPKLKFDLAFGAGALTGGGEDIDFFTRVLFAKRTLVVQPDAIVWHRHRADEAALTIQAKAYGIGLGAWLTKLALTPKMWLPLAKKITAGRRQLRNLGDLDGDAATDVVDSTPEVLLDPDLEAQIRKLEKRAILEGPKKYFQQRAKNRRDRKKLPHLGFKQVLKQYPLLWGGTLIAAAQALLLIPSLPSWMRGLVLGVFIFTQPGILLFYRHGFITRMRLLLIIGISLSASLILTTFAAMSQLWYPQPTLLAFAGVIVVGHVIATIREVRKPV